MAAIIMVIVLAVVGVGTWAAFQGVNGGSSGSGKTSVTTCSPPTNPVCTAISGGHDVFLNVPYRSVQSGIPIHFTAQYQGSGSVSYYLYNFGDGQPALNSTSPSVTYSYAGPGTFIASVQAKIAGQSVLHDNYRTLLIVNSKPSASNAFSAEVPTVSASVSANDTSTTSATAVLLSSGSVTLNGSYVANPSDPASTPIAPSMVVSANGTLASASSAGTYSSGKVTFSTPGIHWVTFVGGGTVGSTTYWNNYTWTVFTAQPGFNPGSIQGGSGNPGPGNKGALLSPHPGTLSVYELVPGGSYSEDPAYDYETAGYEPIVNVYQTLIGYNGSATGATWQAFTPQAATCVPGSPQCQSLYGASFTGISADQMNYTFVISSQAHFWDPVNSVGWGVYPSDVVFSLARTLGFSTGSGWTNTNGWIIAQALLSVGNATWDGLHAQANNTPANVFASMSVNDSAFCPAAAMTNDHGCVTFHASANGHPWPYFLELIADALGSAIVPCGYFSAAPQNGGIPGWTNGTISGLGDHPCTLPGGATTTTDPAFAAAVAAMPDMSWDSWEILGSQGLVGDTAFTMAGSGPYYMKAIHPGSDFLLQANPDYVAPCSWTGCMPAAGSFAQTVSVIWERTATQGEQAYKAGTADHASIPTTDLSLLFSLINGGGVQLNPFSTISIYFHVFNMGFDPVGQQQLVPASNIPYNWMSYLGMRQFLANAYPYHTIDSTIETQNGLTFNYAYGGAIPHGMQSYYVGNISWPAGDPTGSATTQGSAAWWWYDPQLAACTTGSPCIVPMTGETGAPDVDQGITAWANQIASLSGGRLIMQSADINFFNLYINSVYDPPYTNPSAVYTLGWAPDYPDPTDYINALYLSNATYSTSGATYQQLNNETQGFNNPACHTPTDYAWWAVEANTVGISNDCQGMAYRALQYADAAAAVELNIPNRQVLYWQAESIANGLALYIYWGQSNVNFGTASWIDGNSINSNITIGGGGDQTFYSWTYSASGVGSHE
jgi:hypothetical protein